MHLTTVCYLLEVVLTTSVVCGSEQHGVLDDLLLTRHEHEKGANKKQKRRVLEDNSLRKEENNFFLPLAFGAIFQCKFSAKKCKKKKIIYILHIQMQFSTSQAFVVIFVVVLAAFCMVLVVFTVVVLVVA